MNNYRPILPPKLGFVEINGEYVEVLTENEKILKAKENFNNIANQERDLMLADLEYRLLLTEFNINTQTK